jgi:hypothetical protein
MKDALISFNAHSLAAWSGSLILDKVLEFVECMILCLFLELLNVLLKVFLTLSPLECHHVLLHAQLLEMSLDIIDGLLIVSEFLLFFTIVGAKVACIQHIVLQRVEMIRE